MNARVWQVEVDGTAHEVELRWTYWGGSREVLLDGRTIDKSQAMMAWKSRQEFGIAGHPAVIETKPKRRVSTSFAISLTVAGRPIEPVTDPAG